MSGPVYAPRMTRTGVAASSTDRRRPRPLAGIRAGVAYLMEAAAVSAVIGLRSL